MVKVQKVTISDVDLVDSNVKKQDPAAVPQRSQRWVLLVLRVPSADCPVGLKVRNLMLDTTEETLRREFSRFKPGSVERVKKLTDYAFVHFRSRSEALATLAVMNGVQIDGTTVEVSLAKPTGNKEPVGGRRNSSRGGGGGGGDETFPLWRNGEMMNGRSSLRDLPLHTRMGNPFCGPGGGGGECELLNLSAGEAGLL